MGYRAYFPAELVHLQNQLTGELTPVELVRGRLEAFSIASLGVPHKVLSMKSFLISVVISASVLCVPTAASAARPDTSKECAKAAYAASLATGQVGASKAALTVAKAAKDNAVKKRNAAAIAAADKRVLALTQEVAAKTARMKAATDAMKVACKKAPVTTKP
jgi:hypothetical protein